MQNKYFKFFIIALALAVIVPQIAMAAWWNPMSWGIWNSIFHFQQTAQKQEQQIKKATTPIVGGDKDAHGCIGSAGYTWCAAKNKCLRTWEEKCDTNSTTGWKTYADNQFNYQIQYPRIKWDVLGESIVGHEILAISSDNKSSSYIQVTVDSSDFINKNLFGGGPQHSPCFLDNVDYNVDNGNGGNLKHSTKEVINGINFKTGDVTTYFEGMNSRRNAPVIEYCTTDNEGTVYVLDALYDTDKANSNILEKILSTFKFTK